MEYLAGRKVMTLGIDSASMGPLPDLAEPTHFAGLKHGMIWTESATGLGELPPTGAFYCMIGPKHAGGIYSEGRAFAVVGDPLARRLIDSARRKNVVDLSVVLSEDRPVSWPGRGVGQPPPAVHNDPLGDEPQHPDAVRDAHARQPRRHPPGPACVCPAPRRLRRSDVSARREGLAGRVRGEVRPARDQRRDDREGADLADLRPGAGHRRHASPRHDGQVELAGLAGDHGG